MKYKYIGAVLKPHEDGQAHMDQMSHSGWRLVSLNVYQSRFYYVWEKQVIDDPLPYGIPSAERLRSLIGDTE